MLGWKDQWGQHAPHQPSLYHTLQTLVACTLQTPWLQPLLYQQLMARQAGLKHTLWTLTQGEMCTWILGRLNECQQFSPREDMHWPAMQRKASHESLYKSQIPSALTSKCFEVEWCLISSPKVNNWAVLTTPVMEFGMRRKCSNMSSHGGSSTWPRPASPRSVLPTHSLTTHTHTGHTLWGKSGPQKPMSNMNYIVPYQKICLNSHSNEKN